MGLTLAQAARLLSVPPAHISFRSASWYYLRPLCLPLHAASTIKCRPFCVDRSIDAGDACALLEQIALECNKAEDPGSVFAGCSEAAREALKHARTLAGEEGRREVSMKRVLKDLKRVMLRQGWRRWLAALRASRLLQMQRVLLTHHEERLAAEVQLERDCHAEAYEVQSAPPPPPQLLFFDASLPPLLDATAALTFPSRC